jgi:outer membrane protein assembly factor BamB
MGQSLSNHSWRMFRANVRRTGVSTSIPICKPSLQWVTEVGPVVSSPVFDGGNLYVSTLTGRVFCLDIGRRAISWHESFGPIVSSPLLTDSLLIGATFNGWIKKTNLENSIYAIDRPTGRLLWEVKIKGDFFSSPCIIDETIIIGSLDKKIYSIDLSGNILWDYETNGEIWSSPSLDNNYVYVGSDDANIYSFCIDGSLRWKTRLNGKVRSSSPCLASDDDLLFCGTHGGGMYCIDTLNGLIKWSKQIQKPVLSSPTVVEGKVIFATSNNSVYCFDSKNGSKLWEFETGNKVWSSPSLVKNDKMVFFGCLDSNVYGVNIETGKQEWKFPTMGMIDSSPCIANGLLFVCSRDGLLYVFGKEPLLPYI